MMLGSTKPAKYSDAAVFACDAAHLKFAWVAASQIAAIEPERRFDLVIATPDFSNIPDIARESDVRFRQIDIGTLPEFVHGNSRISIGTFFRHLLPQQLADEYQSLFYMDTDTWMRRPGLQGLLDRRPRGLPIAAAPTFIYHPNLSGRRHPVSRRAQTIFEALPHPGFLHWQSGVMLLDVEAYMRAGIAERVFDFVRGNGDTLRRLRLGDQGALNGVIGKDVAVLDPRWNWHHESWMTPSILARFDPFILHFIGKAKPWQIQDDPIIQAWHKPWAEKLQLWDPTKSPEIREGSTAWLAAHPVTGIGVLDSLHRAAVGTWARSPLAQPRPIPKRGLAAMTDMIRTAEVR